MKSYGIKIEKLSFFSADLVAKYLSIIIPDEIRKEQEEVKWIYLVEYYDVEFKSIFDVLMRETKILHCTIQKDQFNEIAYLHFLPLFPWEVEKKWTNLSKQDIRDEIFYVLKPLLNPELKEEDVFSLCLEYN